EPLRSHACGPNIAVEKTYRADARGAGIGYRPAVLGNRVHAELLCLRVILHDARVGAVVGEPDVALRINGDGIQLQLRALARRAGDARIGMCVGVEAADHSGSSLADPGDSLRVNGDAAR